MKKVSKEEIKSLLSEVEKKLLKTIHEKPSKEALDRLAVFAGFQDWASFQKELHESPDENSQESAETPVETKTKK